MLLISIQIYNVIFNKTKLYKIYNIKLIMNLGNFGVEVKEDKPREINDNKLDIDLDRIKSDYTPKEIERYLPWFLKFKVEKFDDLVITKEIKKLIDFFENFKPGKGILLCGRAGSGKTTTLTLIGEKYGFEIFELNASDARSKKSIVESVGDVIKQRSLFGKSKMVLIDEADGVAGKEDRGGIAELTRFVKESKYPIVFTANDSESDKIKALKKVATFIDFENHSYELMINIAKKIFEQENIKYDLKELEKFVEERSTIDIRGFINDLQASTIASEFKVGEEGLEIRDYKKKIDLVLDKIYFSYPEDAYQSAINTDINLDDLMLYVEENTPLILKGNSLVMAFNEISKADTFKGRIISLQYWRYLVYINFYLTYGVSSVKENPVKAKYKRNERILKKWIYGNQSNAIGPRTKAEKDSDTDLRFIEKLAKSYGRSANRTRKDDIRFFSIIYKNDLEFREAVKKKYEIGEDVEKALGLFH